MLGPTIQGLLQAGLAPSTHWAYVAGKLKYLKFCKETGTPTIPVTERGLMHFIAYVTQQGLGYITMRSYRSEIRHLQVSAGGGDPEVGNMPLVSLMLWGARTEQAGQPGQLRLPITPSILMRLHQMWSHKK